MHTAAGRHVGLGLAPDNRQLHTIIVRLCVLFCLQVLLTNETRYGTRDIHPVPPSLVPVKFRCNSMFASVALSWSGAHHPCGQQMGWQGQHLGAWNISMCNVGLRAKVDAMYCVRRGRLRFTSISSCCVPPERDLVRWHHNPFTTRSTFHM
jgi:hypothetical protein